MKIVIGDNSKRNTPMIVHGVTLSKIIALQHFLLNNTRMHDLYLLVHIGQFRVGIVTRNKKSWYSDLRESRAPIVIPTVIMDSSMR
jgi:hypothetical protein